MARFRLSALVCTAALLVGTPLPAQVIPNDPYAPPAYQPSPPPPPPPEPPGNYGQAEPTYQPVDPSYAPPPPAPYPDAPPPIEPYPAQPAPQQPVAPPPAPGQPTAALPCGARTALAQPGTQGGLAQDDVVAAAEGVFGKGAKGLAGLIEGIFRDRGEPSAYIAGREAGGAFIVGLRYGSGTMCHKIEGDKKVYWTGPSIGFDVGADANRVFVLVYNLHDSQELFRRYPTAEGRAYFVGGFSASVLQRGDVTLVPIRLGVGMRLGVNGGYMNFTEKSRVLPF